MILQTPAVSLGFWDLQGCGSGLRTARPWKGQGKYIDVGRFEALKGKVRLFLYTIWSDLQGFKDGPCGF